MNDSVQDATQWAMVASGAGIVLRVLISVAWLALVVGVVWKSRPDAARILLIGVLLGLVQSCVGTVLTPALSFFAARSDGGTAAMVRMNSVAQIAMGVTGLAPQALLMAGVALLARPRRREVRDPDVAALDADAR